MELVFLLYLLATIMCCLSAYIISEMSCDITAQAISPSDKMKRKIALLMLLMSCFLFIVVYLLVI